MSREFAAAGSRFHRAVILLRKRKAIYLVGRDLLAGLVFEARELAQQLEMAERRIAYLESQQTPGQIARACEEVAAIMNGYPTAEEAEALHEASGMGDGCGTFQVIEETQTLTPEEHARIIELVNGPTLELP